MRHYTCNTNILLSSKKFLWMNDLVQENNYLGKFKVGIIFEFCFCFHVFDYKRDDLIISTLVFVKGYGLLDRKEPLV